LVFEREKERERGDLENTGLNLKVFNGGTINNNNNKTKLEF
jgi:hypothetical protein